MIIHSIITKPACSTQFPALPQRPPAAARPLLGAAPCLPGPPTPGYQYVPTRGASRRPETILVSERVPPRTTPYASDPRRPRPPAGQHEPARRRPQHCTTPRATRPRPRCARPRLPPPEYRHAPRMVPEARHMAPMQPEVRYRVPINHHEVALVASGGPASFVPAGGAAAQGLRDPS
ncbi:leucine-rich repeat extensin-like protein 3 [Penaeus monodon]|uniref:leucine-rich repeat extensin-like protein 3 n=1 Tax=Penaeus monodon TaxID=6687 RepID=UPI0018A7C01D|nr:leucine-rich repeat extensin-like protein 3 [Penaeus monodon]